MRTDDVFEELLGDDPEIAEIAAEVDPPSFLAANVYRLRNAQSRTQAELAAAVGISQPRIAEIERGDANPRLVTLGRLAYALRVSVADLLQVPPGHPARSLRRGTEESTASKQPERRRKAG